MSDIEPVRHEPKKLAGRQRRHVEIEIAGFERGIRAAVLHLERTGHHRAALVLRTEALPLVAGAVEEFRGRQDHIRPALILLCAGMTYLSAGRIDEASGGMRVGHHKPSPGRVV